MPAASRILLVEDDPNLGFVTQESLERQGFEVTLAGNGESGYAEFAGTVFDLCLIDIMLPEKDGITLARDIRQLNPRIPIIFVTAKSLKEDRIAGFKVGCDDYIVKPFSMEELVLRIQAVLRRTKPSLIKSEQQQYRIGSTIFDYKNSMLIFETNRQKLTHKESELLRLLCLHLNQVLDRQIALNLVWGENNFFMARSMDVYLSKLRKYLQHDQSVRIENIHGKGFKLVVESDD
ncbi:DNA-binding response regulator [candidate division KSB1 bacterium]|nr:response regulator transcription factor [candidate division KSB1 bacterium]RQW06117.1 MAG: DNA-binding response regulator [candidate division KSB1 bacterium]